MKNLIRIMKVSNTMPYFIESNEEVYGKIEDINWNTMGEEYFKNINWKKTYSPEESFNKTILYFNHFVASSDEFQGDALYCLVELLKEIKLKNLFYFKAMNEVKILYLSSILFHAALRGNLFYSSYWEELMKNIYVFNDRSFLIVLLKYYALTKNNNVIKFIEKHFKDDFNKLTDIKNDHPNWLWLPNRIFEYGSLLNDKDIKNYENTEEANMLLINLGIDANEYKEVTRNASYFINTVLDDIFNHTLPKFLLNLNI